MQRPHLIQLIYRNLLNQFGALIYFLLCIQPIAISQINYVPNHSFEEITDCDIEFGDVPKATPWHIVDFPATSPDLWHYCSTSNFYVPPAGAQYIEPKDGEGMIGQVNLVSQAEERVYVPLIDDLPEGVDIYVACSVVPFQKTGTEMELLCYSNTQSLAFSDIAFQNRVVVLESDTVIDKTEDWTTMQTCYQANGTEEMVLMGNYKLTSETLTDCDNPDPNNFVYFLVDEVIVSPFDVIPDTAYLCGDEILNMDVDFYEVPLHWNDGIQGGIRIINEEGQYVVLGDVGDCFLTDTMVVIKIPDDPEIFNVSFCEGGSITLETPFPTIWNNGDTSTFYEVSNPGIYDANMLSVCGERFREYIVEEGGCEIQYFVPNVFTPNDDGINDELEFFFKSEFDFSGELSIFDRWGNLLYHVENIDSSIRLSWNGFKNGEKINPGVFVWMYHYWSAQDGKPRVISGDVTLVY